MEDSDFSEENEDEYGAKEDTLDPDNPEDFFPIMERNFNRTLTEMELMPESAQFADEYNKLFEAFYHAYSGEKALEEKAENMQREIDDKTEKLMVSEQMTEIDKTSIDNLKSEIVLAKKLADAAHAREQLAQEIIDNLRRQVENLNAEIDFRNKMAGDTDEGGETSKHKDALERERDRLINEVNQLNTKLTNALGYQEELERKASETDLKINEYAGLLEDQVGETNRHKRAREKLEDDIGDLKFKIESKEAQTNDLNVVIENHIKHNNRLEIDIKEAKSAYDKVVKELEVITTKLTKLQAEYNNSLYELDKAKKNAQEKSREHKICSEEVHHYKADILKFVKVRDGLEKKILMVTQEMNETVSSRNILRHRIVSLEREIDDFKRIIDEHKRVVEGLVKEKDILSKQLQRQQAVQADMQKLMFIQEQTKKKMELELDTFFMESGKQKKIIGTLERERDRLAEDQIELTQTIQDNIEDIREKKGLIFDLKKSAAEAENKIRQQQNLYEAMRSDRNALQKCLQESNAECNELKKKLKILFHQIEQLKEDIGMKEKMLVKDENVMRKMTKETENLRIELMAGKDQIRVLKEEIKELREEEKRLHKTILENQRVMRDQAKNLEQLMNERDVLGSQLVRRNDEIALLNDKIVILQATLSRGETHYAQRIEDLKLLKLEIKRLRQEKNFMSKSMNNMIDLRQEIFHLERDLTKSRLKCKALEQEVQNPLNIHRWRKLEGSDPDVIDLLQKIQILQKRLLYQGTEAVERERQLKEAERLYLNLKDVLSRQPGPAIQEELSKVQRELKLKNDKLKCLVSELNMTELKCTDYKSDLQRIADELSDLKKKYLAEKKANRALKMSFESTRELNQSRSGTNEVKFTGGGFRMSVQQVTTK